MSRGLVLLSAGLDSTVNLFRAKNLHEIAGALTFDYGQRAAHKEVSCAAKICALLGIQHQVVSLPFFKGFGKSALIDSKLEIPKGDQVSIDNFQISTSTAKAVWVPNRNGIFLNIAAGFAEAMDCDVIIPGFNKEESTTFPDNTNEFLKALTHSFSYSTANKIRAVCYTTDLNKTEIVSLGQKLNVPWHLTWPCYFSDEKWCGQCESCQRAKRAFQDASVEIKW